MSPVSPPSPHPQPVLKYGRAVLSPLPIPPLPGGHPRPGTHRSPPALPQPGSGFSSPCSPGAAGRGEGTGRRREGGLGGGGVVATGAAPILGCDVAPPSPSPRRFPPIQRPPPPSQIARGGGGGHVLRGGPTFGTPARRSEKSNLSPWDPQGDSGLGSKAGELVSGPTPPVGAAGGTQVGWRLGLGIPPPPTTPVASPPLLGVDIIIATDH